MIKKIVILTVFLMLASVMVLAQEPGEQAGEQREQQEIMPVNAELNNNNSEENETEEDLTKRSGEIAKDAEERADNAKQGPVVLEEKQEMIREQVQTGLNTALENVENEDARENLERNLNRWMEQYESRFQNMESVEVEEVNEETGEVRLKAKKEVKYLGFIKGKATNKYNINAEGQISEKAPWFRFLYKEQNTENTE